MIVVRLPWPSSVLSPNARVHPREKAEVVSSHRMIAKVAAWERKLPPVTWQRILVTYHFRPPDQRHRDLDNMHGSCKAYLDGIFDALELNDKLIKQGRQQVHPQIDKVGEIAIVLEEAGEDIPYPGED